MNGSIRQAAAFLKAYDGSPMRLMEVCGTHTAEISANGIKVMSLNLIMEDPEQRKDFLDFCYRYDSSPYVCGMGKDNLFAMGRIPE